MKDKSSKLDAIPRGTTPFFAMVAAVCAVFVIRENLLLGVVLLICSLCILAEKTRKKITGKNTLKRTKKQRTNAFSYIICKDNSNSQKKDSLTYYNTAHTDYCDKGAVQLG